MNHDKVSINHDKVSGKRTAYKSFFCLTVIIALTLCLLAGCGKSSDKQNGGKAAADPAEDYKGGDVTESGTGEEWEATTALTPGPETGSDPEEKTALDPGQSEDQAKASEASDEKASTPGASDQDPGNRNSSGKPSAVKIRLDSSWKYAGKSKIKSGAAVLYQYPAGKGKGITVCINAGHGTKGGENVMTLSHPDGSPKVTGGTTGKGAKKSMAISSGMTFQDGTAEATATLSLARIIKKDLLEAGYNVLMIREKEDVQLDNIARTVIANNMADCHIALHYDDTASNKGVYFLSVPDNERYRSMEPVKSIWKEDNRLGSVLVSAIHKQGFKLFSDGEMPMDLTQTSYSSVPSVDLEVGDGASDHSAKMQKRLSKGIVKGIDNYFKQ